MSASLDNLPGRGRLAILSRGSRLDLAAGALKTHPFFNCGVEIPPQTGLNPLSSKPIQAFLS